VPHETITVGNVEIVALLDVDVNDEPIADAFPGAPDGAMLAGKARYPDVYADDDAWRLRVRVWLIRHPGGLLLLDTGVGPETSPAMDWCPQTGVSLDSLAEIGVEPDAIDVVALSHAHDDHIGGILAPDGSPAFPQARYLLQRADHAWLRGRGAEGDVPSTFERSLAPLERAGVLELIDGDHRISEQIQLRHAPGHTPGHQVLRVASGGAQALLSADTWNHPLQLANPDWWAGSDDDHERSTATRRALLAELLAEPETVVAPTHFGEAFGHVSPDPDGPSAWHPTV
jgi:glyoxylase-like metal-dependent hydrolase (beta-lactamase superfamily II)